MSSDIKKINKLKKNSRRGNNSQESKFVERLIKISRVSKVTKGGHLVGRALWWLCFVRYRQKRGNKQCIILHFIHFAQPGVELSNCVFKDGAIMLYRTKAESLSVLE